MRLSRIMMATGLLAALTGSAKADFLPVFDSSPPAGTPSDAFTYSLNFTTGVDSANGGPNATLPSGSFITIYDIPGLTSLAQVALTGPFSAALQLIGVTPSGIAPSDNPGLENLTITYTGPTLAIDSNFLDALVITDPGYTNTVLAVGQFTSKETKASGPEAGSDIKSLGSVAIPRAVPEPASMTLIGLGLAGVALKRRHAKKARN